MVSVYGGRFRAIPLYAPKAHQICTLSFSVIHLIFESPTVPPISTALPSLSLFSLFSLRFKAQIAFKNNLADADVFRSNLHKLVVLNELKAFLKAHLLIRNEL